MTALAGVWTPGVQGRAARALVTFAGALRHRISDAGAHWHGPDITMLGDSAQLPWDEGLVADGPLVLAFTGCLEDRATLRALLAFSTSTEATSDARLVLAAYRQWGERCVARLTGEFAFSLWDGSQRSLFCARDRFGIRPLVYTAMPQGFAWASDPAGLLALPEFNRALDPDALADFLLFGYHRDPAGTPYRALRQLPPAHTLRVEHSGRLHLRRYWSPAELDAGPTRDDAATHVEQVREALSRAVADRTREGNVAIFLSGGLDSTSILASAATAAPGAITRAYTVDSRPHYADDEEPRLAALAAARHGVPIAVHDMRGTQPLDDWLQASPPQMAPVYSPFTASHLLLMAQVAADGHRLVLTGEGGDPALLRTPAYVTGLLRSGYWAEALRELHGHWRWHRSLRGLGWRSALRRSAGAKPKPALPDWFDPRWAAEQRLTERWTAEHVAPAGPPTLNRSALADLNGVAWYETRFRQDEGSATDVQARYPLFDLRVIAALLATPDALRRSKQVLREAMRDHLPPEIVQRPKTPQHGNPLHGWLRAGHDAGRFPESLPHLACIVDATRYGAALERHVAQPSPYYWDTLLLVLPMALERWLQSVHAAAPVVGAADEVELSA
jgi:asparagine synthase (glutamine-hydrolysing)